MKRFPFLCFQPIFKIVSNVNGHIIIQYIIYLLEYHRKAPIPIIDKVMNASSRLWIGDLQMIHKNRIELVQAVMVLNAYQSPGNTVVLLYLGL